MLPVVGPEEMRALDAASPLGVDELIRRAGNAVARVAIEMLGGTYGRRVVVVCGKGNNGADGRIAAEGLRRRGVRVVEVDAEAASGAGLPPCDLVIDAAFGTGFRGDWEPPVMPEDALVLAVDVPSGRSSWADVTVTFAALKPSLVFDVDGRAGAVLIEDIGLDVDLGGTWVVEPADVVARLPRRSPSAHKYHAAVAVVAGSPGMTGAAALTCAAAMRAGSGYCRLGVPGATAPAVPVEVVSVPLPIEGWADDALAACDRMKALAIGPGLGRLPATADAVRRVVAEAPVPVVVDADGLHALGDGSDLPARDDVVLTPHDGEFARLAGEAPPDGPDRIAAVQALAERLGLVVLLKGPVTVVADPAGQVRLSRTGTPALATAGTGDVLTGILAAFLAQGLPPLEAASLAATAHGAAGLAGPRVGLVASDLPPLVSSFLGGAP